MLRCHHTSEKRFCIDTSSIKTDSEFYCQMKNDAYEGKKSIVTDIINGKTNLITKTCFSLFCFNPKNVENATNAKTMKNFCV